MFKKIGEILLQVVKSKTALGVILGVVAVLISAGEFFPDAPPVVVNVLATISVFLTTFGLFDAANQEKGKFIEKIRLFLASQPFYGLAVVALGTVLDELLSGNYPIATGLLVVLKAFGAILTALGLRNEAARGRLNTIQPPVPVAEKYKHL